MKKAYLNIEVPNQSVIGVLAVNEKAIKDGQPLPEEAIDRLRDALRDHFDDIHLTITDHEIIGMFPVVVRGHFESNDMDKESFELTRTWLC